MLREVREMEAGCIRLHFAAALSSVSLSLELVVDKKVLS